MKYKQTSVIIIFIAMVFFNACGPTEEEQAHKEQARQDSLEQVHRQRMEQQRQDSLDAVQSGSINASQNNNINITFHENGHYAVQVGAWRSQRKAQTEISTWNERGFDHAFVVKFGDEKTGDIWFRVRLGKLQNRQAAQDLQQNLQEQYQVTSWVSKV